MQARFTLQISLMVVAINQLNTSPMKGKETISKLQG
jgi:hypothetical protein